MRQPQPTKVFWDIGAINSDTKFILDFKANEALGCFDREQLLSNKHPDLVRYLLDAQDIDWLINNQILATSFRGYRPLILVLNEVKRLATTEIYRNIAKFHDLDGFRVPAFMIQKIRNFFKDLDEANKLATESAMTAGGKLSLSASLSDAINVISSYAGIKPIQVILNGCSLDKYATPDNLI